MPLTPADSAQDVIARGRALLVLSHATNPRKLAEDLRRSAYVMAGAAIDTYFHQRIFKEATIAPITKKAGEVGIRLRDVDHIIEPMLESRRAATNGRPRVIIKRNLREQLARETYQGVLGIEQAAEYLAIRNPWQYVADELGTTPAAKQRIAETYQRRNRIAHEGDLVREERPRTINRQPLGPDDAQAALDLAEATVRAFDEVRAET